MRSDESLRDEDEDAADRRTEDGALDPVAGPFVQKPAARAEHQTGGETVCASQPAPVRSACEHERQRTEAGRECRYERDDENSESVHSAAL